jgi:hypothetical protein
MQITEGVKVNWNRAAQNGVEGSLLVVGITKRGNFEFAQLQANDGRLFTQVVQAASLTVVDSECWCDGPGHSRFCTNR